MAVSRCLLGLLLLIATAAQAQQDFSGTTPSGAKYRIAVPAGWQPGGPLVLYQHGFDFDAEPSAPGLGPLRETMLAQGYAIAASSYSQRGWAVFRAIGDNRELVDAFTTRVGAPGEIIPFGGSLGGLLALKIAEADGFPPVHGVYALCPAAAGSRLWDHAIDLRLAYDVICANAGDLPQGEAPIRWAYDLDDIPDEVDDLADQAELLPTLLPLNQCTGINLPPSLRSDDKRRRLAQLMQAAGTTDEDFLLTNMAYATYAMSELVRAPDKLGGRNPFTTAGVAYADSSIDAGIQRIAADLIAARQLRWYSDFRGDIGAAKILSLHTSRDELVVPANQSVLRSRVPGTQLTSAIVAEAEPTHCGFTDAEGLAGWNALRAWMAQAAAQPTVSSLQADCRTLSAGGTTGPCRFDDSVAVPPLDSVIAPRPAASAPDVDGSWSGQWYDPTRSGEGVLLEVLPGQRALATFFTYPPAGVVGKQAWLSATGRIVGNGVAFDRVVRPRMVRGNDGVERFEQTAWGSLWLDFTDCSSGRLRWEGPDGWGKGESSLTRLTALQGLDCGATGVVPTQASGSWYDPDAYGSGFAVERLDGARTAISWFSPGTVDGGQAWMGGIVEGDLAAGLTGQSLYRTEGTRFGSAFRAADVRRIPAMQLDLRLGCGLSGTARYVTTPSLPGSGLALDLQRITRPLGIPDCP